MCHHTMWSHCVRVSCFWPCCGLGVWCVVFRGSWAASHASLCRFSGLQSVSRLGFKALETLCSAAGSSGGLGGPSIPLTSRALTSEQGSYSVVEMRTFLLLGTLVLYFYQKNNIPCSCFQHCAPGRFSSSAPSLFSPISVSKQRGRLGKGLDAGTWQTGEAPARLATRGRHQGASSAWKPAGPTARPSQDAHCTCRRSEMRLLRDPHAERGSRPAWPCRGHAWGLLRDWWAQGNDSGRSPVHSYEECPGGGSGDLQQVGPSEPRVP